MNAIHNGHNQDDTPRTKGSTFSSKKKAAFIQMAVIYGLCLWGAITQNEAITAVVFEEIQPPFGI
jgi:hypothetical protein